MRTHIPRLGVAILPHPDTAFHLAILPACYKSEKGIGLQVTAAQERQGRKGVHHGCQDNV